MYYATDLFVRRGPLATLWLAGSLQRKVTKQQIQAANIQLLWSTHLTDQQCHHQTMEGWEEISMVQTN